MKDLNNLFRELLDREIERNEALAELGYAGFSLSDEEVYKHALDIFVSKVQEKAVEAANGRTP
tara:strand:+ start:1697 stop:1885 length:189 start_codon:yes stop_codon:yes gene_type:complete